MLVYYLKSARNHLLQAKAMTLAMILALALGVGASMVMLTEIRVMTWDPLPDRSGQLFHPSLDALPMSQQVKASQDPRISLTWHDAQELLRRAPTGKQVALASGRLLVNPQEGVAEPFFIDGQYTTPDIFALFGIELRQGRTWTAAEEEGRAHVAVISQSLGDKLTGPAPIIGRLLELDGQSFRIIGVAADWAPSPRFHTDMQKNIFKGREDFFIPLHTAVDLQLNVSADMFSWSSVTSANRMQDPNTSWLQLWAELDNQVAQQAYRQFLENYVRDQNSMGRFERKVPPHLDDLRGYLIQRRIVPDNVKLQLGLALAFLVVCLVNICALVFARFINRTHEIAVRRALGARRRDIVAQLGVEALIVGALGGLAALLVAAAGLHLMRGQPDAYVEQAVMDWSIALSTLALACLSSIAAASLPTLRAASMRIAMQIRTEE